MDGARLVGVAVVAPLAIAVVCGALWAAGQKIRNAGGGDE